MGTQTQGELVRQVGTGAAVAVIIGEVIGVGIFLTPAGMAKSLGSPFWLLLVWLFSGGIALSGALCYGELAARFPDAGGGYVYLREAYGPRWAFLYGWMSLLVMDPGITATCAVGMASYFGYAANIATPLLLKSVAIATILSLALANIAGMRLSAGLIKGLTLIKVGLLLFLAVWGFGLRLGDWSHFVPLMAQKSGSEPLVGALAAGMVLGFFSFGGWWDVSKIAGEVRNPQRTLPLAFALGVTAVTVIYILTSAVFLYLVPLEHVTSGQAFAAQAGEVLFGTAGRQILSGIVVVSVLSSLAALMTSTPRVYFAMARDGLFLPAAAAIHPRYGTPTRAIALQALLAAVLVAVGTFEQILAYFFFAAVVFVALTVAATLVLRRKGGRPPGYQTAGYPFTPIAFLVSVTAVLVLLAARNPKQSLLGAGVVALGLPVYQVIFRHSGRHLAPAREMEK